MHCFQIKLNKRPWHCRWERMGMKGIDNASWEDNINEKMWRRKKDTDKPWEKYDLMKQYRSVTVCYLSLSHDPYSQRIRSHDY